MIVTGVVKQGVIVAMFGMTAAMMTMFATILLIGVMGATATAAKVEVLAMKYPRQSRSLIATWPNLARLMFGRMQKDSCFSTLPIRGSTQMLVCRRWLDLNSINKLLTTYFIF